MNDTDIQELRLQLIANGYAITRNHDKRTFQRGWPTTVVDAGEIARWSRRFSRDKATGIRVEDGLAVIDIDIDDQAVVDACANAIFDAVPRLEDAAVPLLVRKGKGAKEAWFVRTAELFSRIHSRSWVKPGETEDDNTHRVEIFGGASARQFGSFGPHTISDDGEVLVRYRWTGPSPADTPKDELPALTKQEFFAVVDAIEGVLKKHNWALVERSQKGESDAVRVYDLTEDMHFDLNTGQRVSLPELRELALGEHGGEGLRCSASFLEGPSARNTTRCLVSSTRAGHVAVWDSASAVTHTEALAQVKDYSDEINRVAERLKEIDERRRHKIAPRDGAAVAATKLLATYAYCPTQQLGIVPIYAQDVGECMTLASFRTLMLPNCDKEVGPRGGEQTINPVDIWASSERRVVVRGMRMRPDKERPLYEEGEAMWVNTYAPVVFTDVQPAGQDAFLLFMEHLLPVKVEREWFLDWLAHKYRYPAIPGPGVIMVSKWQGAGRGTLFTMVRQLFGSNYARKVDGATLTGEGGQSQYNTWMASSLVILIDELFNAGTGAHLWQRKKAYDRIKGLIDPASRDVEIIQKTLNNYVTQTYASFLMATNNLNALPLDEDDRRICVLSNKDVMATRPDVEAALEAHRRGDQFSDEFIVGVAEVLQGRPLAGYNAFATPPMFEGKRNMINHNTTEVGEAAEEALAELPGDYVTRNAFVERVRVKMGDAAREEKHLVQEARDRLDRSKWVFLGRTRVRDNGAKADVWARTEEHAREWNGSPHAARPKMLEPNNDPKAKATTTQMAALAAGLALVKR